MTLPELAIRRHVSMLMLIVSLTVLGGVALFRLPLAFMPDVEQPMLFVQLPYTNASPAQVERLIVRPVEEALGSVGGLRNMWSHIGDQGGTAFYTTQDDIAKVFEFYSTQPGITPMGTGLMPTDDGRSGAAFSGDNIMISIKRPYLDMSAATFDEEKGVTGEMIDSTLISIQKY